MEWRWRQQGETSVSGLEIVSIWGLVDTYKGFGRQVKDSMEALPA
jgi:hypothetical protein